MKQFDLNWVKLSWSLLYFNLLPSMLKSRNQQKIHHESITTFVVFISRIDSDDSVIVNGN